MYKRHTVRFARKSIILAEMPKKKAPELTDQERAKRIKEMTREVEADKVGEPFR